MKIFTRFFLYLVLVFVSGNLAHSELLNFNQVAFTDTTFWEMHGASLMYVSYTSQPHNICHAEWDSVRKTYVLTKMDPLVFQLNTFSEQNQKYWIDYGQRGGDYIISKIIDIRNTTTPYLTFLYQRGGYVKDNSTGKCDEILSGPEFRVVEKANPLIEVRKPDQLLVELISADSSNLVKLNNPKESDWNVHPSRYGLPPVTGNPALSIFGGGGYRVGFLEDDKDSSLTYDQGLRMDLMDAGSDDRFRRAYVIIPEQFRKNGFIRVRFRVDAERNGDSVAVKDDADDFYLDDLNVVGDGKPDVALNSLYIQNPYSVLNFNTKYEIPFYADISSIFHSTGDSFKLKIRIKPQSQNYWSPAPDEAGFTTEDGYSKILTFTADFSPRIISLPPIKINKFNKTYLTPNTVFQVWAVVMPSAGNSIISNDTLLVEFSVHLGSVIAYDESDNPYNSFSQFDNYQGTGLNLFGFSLGTDLKEKKAMTGSGRICMNFDIIETDTVYGYQAYWAPISQTMEDVEFTILKESGQPGALQVAGSQIFGKRGWDDINKDFYWDKYVTYLLPTPVILKPGNYWMAVSQMGETRFNLGGSKYRMASATTSTFPGTATTYGSSGYSILFDQSYKRLNTIGQWINSNRFAYENIRWSGNWFQFTPTVGNPAYAHLNHEGMVGDSFKTYTRGSFVPMLRLYMDGSNYVWNDVKETLAEKEFDIQPNPATDFIEISAGARRAVPNEENIHIFNVLGEEMKNLSPALSEGDGVRIDVSDLPAGVYFVRVGDRVGKFVKI